MIVNVGLTDRIIRGVLGIILVASIFFISNMLLKVILGIFGLILLFTAITGFCGLYKVFGISTCPIKREG